MAVLVAWERAGLLGRLAPCFPIAFILSTFAARIPRHDTRTWEFTPRIRADLRQVCSPRPPRARSQDVVAAMSVRKAESPVHKSA